jgi:hypothetical protein
LNSNEKSVKRKRIKNDNKKRGRVNLRSFPPSLYLVLYGKKKPFVYFQSLFYPPGNWIWFDLKITPLRTYRIADSVQIIMCIVRSDYIRPQTVYTKAAALPINIYEWKLMRLLTSCWLCHRFECLQPIVNNSCQLSSRYIYIYTHPSPISSNKLMTIRTVPSIRRSLYVQSKVMPGLRTFLHRDDYLSVRFSLASGRVESPLVSIVEGWDPPAQCIQEYLGL